MSAAALVLASASPRRRELLERVGLAIDVRPADVDERVEPGEDPAAYVMRVAWSKASSIAATRRSDRPGEAGSEVSSSRAFGRRAFGRWVLAADTTVTIDGEILAKAESPTEARAMIAKLAGRTHQVMTAFVLMGGDAGLVTRQQLVSTDVTFAAMWEWEIDAYVASGEWRGKAGAYAIQGIGAALVKEVKGSVTNVIGLPLAEVLAALREVGGPLPAFGKGVPA